MCSEVRRSRQFSRFLLSALIVAFSVVPACSRHDMRREKPSVELKSISFPGGVIPRAYSSCGGQDGISPELSWGTVPKRTQSFAVIAFDSDSPLGFEFTHWVIYDISATERDLSRDIRKREQLSDGSRQGPNDYDRIGYVGPCPPGHSTHHYIFDLDALDTKLDLPPRSSRKELQKAMKRHILAIGELVGSFKAE